MKLRRRRIARPRRQDAGLRQSKPGLAHSGLRFAADFGIGAMTALLEEAPAPPPPPKRAPARTQERESAGSKTQDLPAERPGRQAETPLQIPPRGWLQIGKRLVAEFSEHRIMAEAASVTFYGLLALFPALAAFVSIYGFFADPARLSEQLGALQGVIPGGGMDILSTQVHALADSSKKALGFGALIGLATSVWSANAGVKSLFDALNVVYDKKETRGFFRLTLISLAFTMGAVAFLILAVGAIVIMPVVLHFIGLDSFAKSVIGLARWPLLFIVVIAFLAVVFRYGPCRKDPKWRWVTPGGVLATLLWVLVSAGFSYYVANFGNYNKTYGSLGAVIGFMTWIWLSMTVILTGAELNSELERQTDQDTAIDEPSDQAASRA